MFATAFCGIIDLGKEELVCANAGHSFPLLYDGTSADLLRYRR